MNDETKNFYTAHATKAVYTRYPRQLYRQVEELLHDRYGYSDNDYAPN